jgi:hypothetical protein
VMRWRPMPCLRVASAALLLALNACDTYDQSLLSHAVAGGTGHGLRDAGDRDSRSLDASLARPDARTITGTAGAASARDAGSIATSMPNTDAGIGRDGGVAAGGDSGLQDGGTPDSGQPPCVPTSVSSYCAQTAALPAVPIIDGVLDCGPVQMMLSPVGWNGSGSLPEDPKTSVAAAWRSNGLYVYVEVRGQVAAPHPSGSRIDCGDAVELYVDSDANMSGSYDTPGTMQFIIAAPSASAPGTIEAARYNGNPHGVWSPQAPSGLTTVRFADGYAVEAFITAADLDLTTWAPSKGAAIGLDIAIDVSGTPYRSSSGCPSTGSQRGQYFMSVSAATAGCSDHQPYCDNRAFCSSELL